MPRVCSIGISADPVRTRINHPNTTSHLIFRCANTKQMAASCSIGADSTHWQRTFLHPMMANFDAPAREECTAERTVSNTPQQALTLLNDPTFVEAASSLATRTLREAGDLSFEQQLDTAFQRVLSRPPLAVEVAALQKLHIKQLATYTAAPADAAALVAVGQLPVDSTVDPVALAAWTQVARVLLNLNEAIVRY